MSFNLDVLRAQVDGILSADNDELSQLRRARQIKAAVEMYSNDRPESISTSVTGDGGKYYLISTVLTSFVEGFSRVTGIEYPAQAVTVDSVPQYLEPEDWDDDFNDGTNRYLLFVNTAPASTETAVVTFTAPYLWTKSSVTTAVNQSTHGFSVDDFVFNDQSSGSSVWTLAVDIRIATHQVTVVTDADNFTAAILEADLPPSDFFAVCNLAASYCADAIATGYARTSSSTITGDAVDSGGRSLRFKEMAADLMNLYKDQMGLLADENEQEYPAAEFVDTDPLPAWGAGNYIFHRDRGRR